MHESEHPLLDETDIEAEKTSCSKNNACPLCNQDNRQITCSTRTVSLAIGSLASSLLMILFFYWLLSVSNSAPNPARSESFFPDIPTIDILFKDSHKYLNKGPAGDKLWLDTLPLGAGYVRVPNPRTYNLPTSEPITNSTTNEESYSISVVHQLHCLVLLRDALLSFERNQKPHYHQDIHPYHCLDYLRKTVLCSADTALEHAHERRDKDGEVVGYVMSGDGDVHRCRDWGVVERLIVERRVDDRIGGLTS